MTFKVKSKKLPETYFREREIMELKRKHKGKVPAFEVIREGFRVTEKYPRQTHKINQVIIYKGKRYVVRKVSRKGVYLSTIKRKNGLIEGFKLGKPKFVPEKDYGIAVPIRLEWFVV